MMLKKCQSSSGYMLRRSCTKLLFTSHVTAPCHVKSSTFQLHIETKTDVKLRTSNVYIKDGVLVVFVNIRIVVIIKEVFWCELCFIAANCPKITYSTCIIYNRSASLEHSMSWL